MKKTMLGVGLLLCAFVFIGNNPAHAAPISSKNKSKLSQLAAFQYDNLASNAQQKPEREEKLAKNPPPAEAAPAQHVVAEGESLTMIAGQHASTWTRLFAKNTQITDPNVIKVGENITIPEPNEQLAERSPPAAQPQLAASPAQPAGQSNGGNRGDSAGNTYFAGYCTWYAKDRRPDLPNSLGNADTWVARAQTLGIPTSSAPRAGAIGQQGMHVVYVESVNSDGTVTISEMNYQGPYITSSRTVAAGNFMYIY